MNDTTIKDSKYDYEVNCSIQPATFILNWRTVEKLIEFLVLVRKTHHDLKAIVAEKVREVERESRRRIKHFIRNKQIAAVSAKISLPTLVIPDVTNNRCSLALRMGQLKVETQLLKSSSHSNLRRHKLQEYKASLTGTLLSHIQLSEDESWESVLYEERLGNSGKLGSVLCKFGDADVAIQYTTNSDRVNIPSHLAVNCCLPMISFSISDTKLEDILHLVFTLSQHLLRILSQKRVPVATRRKYFHQRHASLDMAHLTSTSVLTPQPFTNYRDVQKLRNRTKLSALTRSRLRAPFLSKTTAREDTDGAPVEDYHLFCGEVQIERIQLLVTRLERTTGAMPEVSQQRNGKEISHSKSKHPYLGLDLTEILLMYDMREQTTKLCLQFSSVLLRKHSLPAHHVKDANVLFSTKERFLSCNRCWADPLSPQFKNSHGSMEEKWDMNLGCCVIHIHLEVLQDIFSFASGIRLPALRDLVTEVFGQDPGTKASSAKVEKQQTLHFQECSVVLSTNNAVVTNATMIDLNIALENTLHLTKLDGRLQNLCITNGLGGVEGNKELFCSHCPDKLLLNVMLKFKEKGKIVTMVRDIVGNVQLGAIRMIYLNSFIRSAHSFCTELYHNYNVCLDTISKQLTAHFQHLKPAKKFPPSPFKKTRTASLSTHPLSLTPCNLYRVTVTVHNLAVVLPGSSHEKEGLRGHIHKLTLTLQNHTGAMSIPEEAVDEPDDAAMYGVRPSPVSSQNQYRDRLFGTVEIAGVGWTDDGRGSDIFKVPWAKISRPLSKSYSMEDMWKLSLSLAELYLTGPDIVRLISVLSSNFSEEGYLALKLNSATYDKTDTNSSESSALNFGQEVPSLNPQLSKSTPHVLEIAIDRLICTLLALPEESSSSSCSVGDDQSSSACRFEEECGYDCSSLITVAKLLLMKVQLVASSERWVTGTVHKVLGVQGSHHKPIPVHINDIEPLDRILYGDLSSSTATCYPVLKLNVNLSEEAFTFELKLDTVAIYLWPIFLRSFIVFLRQCRSSLSRESQIPGDDQDHFFDTYDTDRLERAGSCGSIGDQNIQRTSTPEKSERSLNVNLLFEECSIALLEDPAAGESTSPGLCVELHSFEEEQTEATVLKYRSSRRQWMIELIPCQFRARLCIQAEQLIPLNEVVHPCSLSASYAVSEQKVTLNVELESIVVQLTNEMVEVLWNFYQALTKVPSVEEDTNVISGRSLYVPVPITENEKLPPTFSIPAEEEELFHTRTVLAQEPKCKPDGAAGCDSFEQAGLLFEKEEEYSVKLPEVVINFDIMCGGESSTLMCLYSASDAFIQRANSNVVGKVCVRAMMYVYNEHVASWEPLLEPIEDHELAGYRPYSLDIKIFHGVEILLSDSCDGGPPFVSHHQLGSMTGSYGSGGSVSSGSVTSRRDHSVSGLADLSRLSISNSVDIGSGQSGGRKKEGSPCDLGQGTLSPRLVMICTSDNRLELTITPASVKAILTYYKAMEEDHRKAMANIRNCIHDTRPPIQVENKTQMDLNVYPGPTFQHGARGEPYSAPIAMHSGNRLLKHLPSRQDIQVHTNLIRQSAVEDVVEATDGPVTHTRSSPSIPPLPGIPEDEEVPDDVFSTPQQTPPSGNFQPNPESSLPFIGKVLLFFAKKDTLADMQDYDYSSDSESDECESLYQSRASITSSASESVQSEPYRVGATASGESMEETDYHGSSVTLNRSDIGRRPLVKKRDYWQPKNLIKSHRLKLQCVGCQLSRSVPVSLPGVFSVILKNRHYGRISVICEVRFRKGVRRVIIRSGLQVKNLLPVIVSLYAGGVKVSEVDRYEQDKDIYDVPISWVIKKAPLSVSVGNEGIPCQQSINWWKMTKGSICPVVLHCPDRTQDGGMFYVKASVEKQPAVDLSHDSASHVITLEAPLAFSNHLPFDISVGLPVISYSSSNSKRDSRLPRQFIHMPIEEGSEEIVCDYPPYGETTLKIEFNHHNLFWSGRVDIRLEGELNTTCSMKGHDQHGTRVRKLYVGVHRYKHSSVIKLYSPFWFVNKTGLDIETEHQAKPRARTIIVNRGKNEWPSLITFKSGKTDERRKMRLKVLGGSWCKDFVMGTVGQAVRVESKKGNFLYEFSVVTNLLKNTLSSILYLLPKYSLLNKTQEHLTCTAICPNGDAVDVTSIDLLPQELKPFWPGKHDHVAIAVDGSEYSVPFSLDWFRSSVILLQDQAQSLVTVSVRQDVICSTVVATLLPATDMSALIEVFNFSEQYSIKFMQSLERGSGRLHILKPEEKMMYTWDNPTTQQQFKWQLVEATEANWLSLSLEEGEKSGRELVKVVVDEKISQVRCCWLSMFEGTHRKLWFFDNPEDLSRLLELKQASDRPNTQLFCSLEGLGISFVNNSPTEVAYASIISSPITWMRKRRGQSEWNLVNQQDSVLLETAWRVGDSAITVGEEMFNFEEMVINSSQGGSIQRSFNPGIWLSYTEYDRLISCNMKLGRIQIDNQLKRHDLPSRVVFAAKELKYEAEQTAEPFLDLFITKRAKAEKHGIDEYQKVFVKVKPMQLNLELGFVAELLPFSDIFASQPDKKEEETQEEICSHGWKRSLHKLLHIDSLVSMAPKHHFDVFQIAHADVLVNYTTAGEYDLTSQWGQIVDAIIHLAILTKGSFDTNFKSVTLKNETIEIKQLQQILVGHYRTEMLWQFQNFALGLDLIGNPVRLMSNFEMGAKDLIMMSHKGIVEGDIGFGIALGVKSFLGHIVGGAAQAAAGTTGAVSNMLLAATDLDYQKSHRHMRNKTSEGLVSSFKLGSKFFIKGMFRGATDIFVKPVTGAAKEGVVGFLQGLGRGTVSILTKPTLGVVDLAKCTMEGIRSAVDDDASIQTVRYPRLIHENKVLVHYNAHEAEGLYILSHMTDPLENEQYVTHDWLEEVSHTARVILISSKKVMLLQKQKKQYHMYWHTPLTSIKRVSLSEGSTELQLVIRDESRFKKKQDTIHTRKVVAEDKFGAKMLYEKIKGAQLALKKAMSADEEYGTEL